VRYFSAGIAPGELKFSTFVCLCVFFFSFGGFEKIRNGGDIGGVAYRYVYFCIINVKK
jgi:hypothetical protein